jgi:hypothetical protein
MWVQFGDHALDGALHQPLAVDRVDVALLDQHEHAGELGEHGERARVAGAGVGEFGAEGAAREGQRGEGERRNEALHTRQSSSARTRGAAPPTKEMFVRQASLLYGTMK